MRRRPPLVQLDCHDAKGRFSFLYNRDWQITSQTDEHVVLRLMDNGDFVAQATVTPWTPAEKGKHLTPEAFREAMNKTPGWVAGEGTAGRRGAVAGRGRWIYRISDAGQDGRRARCCRTSISWPRPAASRLVVAVTLTPKQAEKLGARDLALVGGIELPAADGQDNRVDLAQLLRRRAHLRRRRSAPPRGRPPPRPPRRPGPRHPDPRDPDLIAHPQRCLLAQRIFGIACGYEDLNDHQRLRDDPLWQTAVDHPGPDDAPQLASPPTLCRLENRVRRADLVDMAAALVECFIASHAAPPEELVLDFDATDDPVHGHQENRFFHGYYDAYCFLPLYVICGDHLLVAYLRPSNIDAALHSRAILKLLVRRLRQAWPDVRLVVRADSGFCRWRLMRWCDRHGVDYLLGLAKNAVLQRQATAWQEQAEQAFRGDADGQAHRMFGEFRYAAGSWDRPRRVIAKAQYLPGNKANPPLRRHHVSAARRRRFTRTVYCQRGDMENRIQEQQRDLFAGDQVGRASHEAHRLCGGPWVSLRSTHPTKHPTPPPDTPSPSATTPAPPAASPPATRSCTPRSSIPCRSRSVRLGTGRRRGMRVVHRQHVQPALRACPVRRRTCSRASDRNSRGLAAALTSG